MIVNAAEGENLSVQLSGENSLLSARAEAEGGSAGTVSLQGLNTLEVLNGGQIAASTQTGEAGSVRVNDEGTPAASVTVSGENSLLSARAEDDQGNAGSVTINTSQLTVEDGAEVSASNVSDESGDITLQSLNTLEVLNGGQITASTQTGKAGSVRVNKGENPAASVTLRGQGSRLAAEATKEGGQAGSVTINTRQMTVSDEAQVTVSSPQGQAGNLEIASDSLSLDRGRITAETGKSGVEGANITLQISDLLTLSNESLISAKAFGQANGGNIGILNANGFIIAFPPEGPDGSDIIANAPQGRGGNITIKTQGIFGLAESEVLSRLNDINASGGIAPGIVEIDTEIDPTRGLTNLPEETVESEVAEGCQAAAGEPDLAFYDIGRGGWPPILNEPLSIETLIVPLIPLDVEGENETVQTWEEIFTIPEMKGKFSLTPACRVK